MANKKTPQDKSKDANHLPSIKIIELLVCPVSQGALKYDKDAQELISENARLAYPIRNGVPIMLKDEARILA